MIDRVRKTVLSIINKENRGWVTPEEFNLFCSMAQLEIFEDYFYEYNRWLNRSNQRLANTEYSDLPKNLREKIDKFAVKRSLTFNSGVFPIPDDIYRLETVMYKNDEIEEAQKKDITYLEKANLNNPTSTYPVFIRLEDDIKIYPTSIQSAVSCYALRKPKNPKWTYMTVSGNPLFNPSATDYQDFEIHPSDETKIIIKILSYVGISIREMDIAQIAENADSKGYQKDNS